MGLEFKRMQLLKSKLITKTIVKNLGSCILWCDTDIICLKNPKKSMFLSLGDNDICGVEERPGENQYYINSGFVIYRCSEKMAQISREVSILMLKNFYNNNATLYQDMLNEVLQNHKKDIRLSFFSKDIECFHNCNNRKGRHDINKISVLHITGDFNQNKSPKSLQRTESKLSIMKSIYEKIYDKQ